MSEKKLHEHERIVIEEKIKPVRLDYFLSRTIRNKSRNKVQAYIREGKVTVNGQRSKGSYQVKVSDEIVWYEHFRKDNEMPVFALDLDVVYETADIIVVNKPAGVPMHPGLGNYDNTLLNALKYYYRQTGQEGNLLKDCLVHRIDKNTTGLVVVPKNKRAYEELERQFLQKSTFREYRAIVWREMLQDQGTYCSYMGRSPWNHKLVAVSEDESFGKEADTHYRVEEHLRGMSLISCQLETGRTHQIRVHMKHAGHPLVGDDRYYLKSIRPAKEVQEVMPRHALHAKKLGFVEPVTGKELMFDSELPADFQQLISLCR